MDGHGRTSIDGVYAAGDAVTGATSVVQAMAAGRDIARAVTRELGGRGDDDLSGGEGDDRLCGGSGNDVLMGGPGNDWLFGDRGDDELLGEDGDDLLVSGSGKDTLDGGAGDDTLIDWNCKGKHSKSCVQGSCCKAKKGAGSFQKFR